MASQTDLRAVRDLYAERPSHYLDRKSDDEKARGCVCIIEAFGIAGAADGTEWEFRDFVGADSLAVWNAEASTDEVLAKLDEFIASQA